MKHETHEIHGFGDVSHHVNELLPHKGMSPEQIWDINNPAAYFASSPILFFLTGYDSYEPRMNFARVVGFAKKIKWIPNSLEYDSEDTFVQC